MLKTCAQEEAKFDRALSSRRRHRSQSEKIDRQGEQEQERQQINPLKPRLFGELLVPCFENTKGIFELEVECYQIPPHVIGLIQQGAIFQGLKNEDPNFDSNAFLSLCNTFKFKF